MAFPPELLLSFSEHLDTCTLVRMMSTNNDVKKLISTYERSICQAKNRLMPLPPLNRILTSSGPVRIPIESHTFRSAHELECRQRRIDLLLEGDLPHFENIPHLMALTDQQEIRIKSLIKTALSHCDRVADCSANVSGMTAAFAIDSQYFIAIQEWLHAPPHLRSKQIYPHRDARQAKISYIRNLEAEDLAALHLLGLWANRRFEDTNKHKPGSNILETTMVFQEAVLHHGSWFLWSHFMGDEAMRSIADQILSVGYDEMTRWEKGVPGIPSGLNMTVIRSAKETLRVDPSQSKLIALVKTMISA